MYHLIHLQHDFAIGHGNIGNKIITNHSSAERTSTIYIILLGIIKYIYKKLFQFITGTIIVCVKFKKYHKLNIMRNMHNWT